MKIEKVNVSGKDGKTVEAGHFTSSYDTYLQFTDLSIEPAREYTLHGYIKANKSGTISCLGSGSNVTTSWSEVKMTIIPDSKTFQVFFYPAEFWIYNWKLELGEVSSPWTPSPLDVKYDLQQAQSEWNQTVSGIEASVSKLSEDTKHDLNEAKTEWNLTADGLRTDIDKKIGAEEAQTLIDVTAGDLRVELEKKTSESDVKTLIDANADSIRLKTGTLIWNAQNSSMSKDGVLTCTNGYFSGEVHATSGVFSGSLNGATGTFSGKLQAATGTFSGDVVAKSFKTSDGVVIGQYSQGFALNKFDRLVTINGWATALNVFQAESWNVGVKYAPVQNIGMPCIIGLDDSSFKPGCIKVEPNGTIVLYYYESYGSGPDRIDKNTYGSEKFQRLNMAFFFSGSWFTNYME